LAADAGASDAETPDGPTRETRGRRPIAGTTVVADSISHADGTAIGVTLPGAGSVTWPAAFPTSTSPCRGGIISSLGDSATFEACDMGRRRRAFCSGSSTSQSEAGDGNQGIGQSFIFCTPQAEAACC